jgi:hypothetical protein
MSGAENKDTQENTSDNVHNMQDTRANAPDQVDSPTPDRIATVIIESLTHIFQERLAPIESVARQCIQELEAKQELTRRPASPSTGRKTSNHMSELEKQLLFVLHALDAEHRLRTLKTTLVYGNRPVDWNGWKSRVTEWITAKWASASASAFARSHWTIPESTYERTVWAREILICTCLDYHLAHASEFPSEGCAEFQLLMTTILRGVDRDQNVQLVKRAKHVYIQMNKPRSIPDNTMIIWDAAIMFAENGFVMVEHDGMMWCQNSLTSQSIKLFS